MKVIDVNESNFEEEVINSKMPVLADFNASWCGPCRMIRPILDEIAESRSEFKIVSINVDDQSKLAEEYGVYSIPCLIAFKDGKEISRNVGLRSKQEILKIMGEK